MLFLIGLGLDLKDISVKALEIVKKCAIVYVDTYTSSFPYSLKKLEKILNKKITIVSRELLEDKASSIILEAKKNNVAILVYGDPLAATTHITLLQEAKKYKVAVKVLHNSSIFNAIAETGLQLYKFGKTASIPKWCKSYEPVSFYNIIKDNLSINAHTLVLVDPGLSVLDALEQLRKASNDNIDNIILCSRIGTDKQKIIYTKFKKILKSPPKLEEPFCFIVPAPLHFTEAEFLENLFST